MMQKVDSIGYKAIPLVESTISLAESDVIIAEETIQTTDNFLLTASTPEDERQLRKQAELKRKRSLLITGIAFTLPILILSMFFMDRFPGENILLLVLTTPVWAIVGGEFHRNAWKTLKHGAANMDTLVSAGSTAAYVMSLVATFFPQVVGGVTFYDTAALIITLIYLGKYLEARAKGQTNDAIKKLIGLQPRMAHVIRQGVEGDLAIEQVRSGDELVVRPGEKFR